MLNTLSIKARLILLGAIAILGVMIAGGFGVNRLAALNQQLAADFHEIRDGLSTLLDIQQANTEFKTQVQEWKNILLRGDDPEKFERYKKSFQQTEIKVQKLLRTAADAMKKEQHPQTAKIEEVIRLHTEIGKLYAAQIELWNPHDPDNRKKADKALSGKDRASSEAMTNLAEAMEKEEKHHLETQVAESAETYASARNILLLLILVILVVVLALVIFTARSITRQIADLKNVLIDIRSNMDLSLRLDVPGKDEISIASRSVNELLDDFHGVVSRMKNSAAQVSRASDDLSNSLTQLSGSVGQQNDATGAMAASVEELAVSVTHIADSSNSAQNISRNSLDLADRGGQVIEQTVTSMVDMRSSLEQSSATVEGLGQRSQEIGSIASVITEIADQTNLLALNAAIEAARAGEQGRGFAVVADEVRKLAERTAKATTEIASVINAIQKDTHVAVNDMHAIVALAGENADIARQAGQAIIDIRRGSGEVVDVTSEIASALKEQNTASDLIAKQVEVIATMSDENSAALGSVKQASDEMKTLSTEMHQTVDRFKV